MTGGDDMTNNQILLKECIKQEREENYPDYGEDSFFEYFSISQLLKDYDLDDDEIMNGITDGANDGGCDGMYVFLNNDLLTEDQVVNISAPKGSSLHFIIIQAKNSTGFGEDALMKWKTVVQNLLDMSSNVEDYQTRYSEAVRDGFMLFRDTLTKLIRNQLKVHIHFIYVTMATQVHPNVKAQADELQRIVLSLYPSSKVDVDFIDADKLMALYNSDMEVSVNLKFADQPIALGRNDEFVALVDLPTYYNFIIDDAGNLRSSFFEANVRDYQGKNSVNASIAETLSVETDEDFWWFNNGVTILSEKVTPLTTKELLIQNPKIVNGLQTSTEIYNYFSANSEKRTTDTRHLLVRILVPVSEKSRDSIILATNNQTSIPKSSLRVTNTIHLQIEIYFKSRGLYYDRRKNYYKNQKKKPADIVGVSFLAQCLISIFLRKPNFARARPSTLLKDDGIYKFLYEDNTDLEVYYKTALLGKKIQGNLKKSVDLTASERGDILFYVLYVVIAIVLGKIEISFNDIKDFDINTINDNQIDEAKSLVYKKYKDLGGNSKVAKSSALIEVINDILLNSFKGVLINAE